MKVAIPLYGTFVAPRFGFADQFLITVILKEQVKSSATIDISNDTGWHERLQALMQQKVTVLLCGGFNRRFEPLAESLGIEVIPGLTGDALALTETYARGESLQKFNGCPMRRGCENRSRQRRGFNRFQNSNKNGDNN